VVPPENRVRVGEYGSLPGSSPLLVIVPTVPGKEPQKLHVLAAVDLNRMAEAMKHDLGLELLVSSGWRPRRWKSRHDYEHELVRRYGSPGESLEAAVARGRKFLAYESPHETGLAVDLGCGGLAPVSRTIERQKKTPVYHWLCACAVGFGFSPYLPEPWHWEHRVPLADYLAGSKGAA